MILSYLGHRLGHLLLTLFIVSFIVFAMVRLIPGDPAVVMAGPEATPDIIEEIRASLGLNRPLLVQYGIFLANLLRGDIGSSFRTHQSVAYEISLRLPATLRLAATGMAISIVLGMGLGILAALRRDTWLDMLARTVSLFGVSSPTFFTGLLFILAFGYYLRLLPIAGSGGVRFLILPAFTVALTSVAFISRLTRASLLEALSQDYVRTARAKGVPGRTVVITHALRNALIAPVTVIGLEFGRLLSGVIVIEIVFTWPGTGKLLIDAIQFRDFPIIQGLILAYTVIFALVNMGVDFLYTFIDPRIALD
jgi:ABC-type dipeptide/oligopeptide/nickel transport system permease component